MGYLWDIYGKKILFYLGGNWDVHEKKWDVYGKKWDISGKR